MSHPAPGRPVPVTEDDRRDYVAAVLRHFHEEPTEERIRQWLLPTEQDHRAWVVRDDEVIVGNLGVYTTSVSVPGGEPLPAAGVTAVGVAQTHRRRGLLRALMGAGLDDAVERGEAVALLYASESAIYPRFGFGTVAPSVTHRIDRGAAFRDPVDVGLVRPATPATAFAQWPAILARLRGQRGGCVARSEAQWRQAVVEDPTEERDGAGPRQLVHVPERGYLAYRIHATESEGLPDGEVRVEELVAADREAEAALWQHACDIDLTTRVTAPLRPPDDVLPALLTDPLRARTRVGSPLYARLLDVPACFGARGYATTDVLTLRLEDPAGDQGGTYRLDASPQGAQVRKVGDTPDLTLPVESAASVWLGGVRATRLLAARRLVEHVPGAAARLDQLLWVPRAPWNPFEF